MELLKRMIKEEWRMHSSVFGSYRFALLPFIILAISCAIFFLHPFLTFDVQQFQLGLHWIIFFLGLNVGTIGFVSTGGMKNVLGEMNLLLFSSRTLPFSERNILGTFLLKDFIYYFFYLILPFIVGNLVLKPSPLQLSLVIVSYSLSFLLGLSLTFFFSVAYRLTNKLLLGTSVLTVLAVLYFYGFGLIDIPSFQFYLNSSAYSLVLSTSLIAVFIGCGILFFKKDAHRGLEIRSDYFEDLSEKFRPLTAKNLIDLGRSSGGFGKIVFSFLIVFVFIWFLLKGLPYGRLFMVNPLLSLAVLMGVTSVSIYTWLNRYDSLKRYLYFPLGAEDLIRSKVEGYLIIGPVCLVGTVTIGFLIFGATPLEFVHSLITSLAIGVYVLAVVVHLAGLEPNTRLLDAPVFLKFVAMSSLVMVPALLVSIFYRDLSLEINLLLLLIYVAAFLSSYLLLKRKL